MPAIGSHDTAVVEEAWDGNAAMTACEDAACYRAICAWSTGADAEARADFKFPHHATAGGPANLNGVRNALARLSQADIPESDQDGVRAHLQRHLDAQETDLARTLETDDVLGVEITAAVGPIHGIGSPPGGDYLTVADLQEMARSYRALADEVKIPVKLGHNDGQRTLREAGFLGSDGVPAAGWVENLRVVGDRLLADLRAVPRKIAELFRVGAYRGRSIEFSRRYTSQATGAVHKNVVTGLALLGARVPAVGGLADWEKLYGRERMVALMADPQTRVFATTVAPRTFGMVSDVYLPLADPDREWDEAAAAARVREWAGGTDDEASRSKLRQAYLYRDGGDGGEGEFRFLVGDVIDGRLMAVPAAVFAIAEQLGDGADLPLEDLERLRWIVGDYYWQLERTPPWSGAEQRTPFEDPFLWSSRNPTTEEHEVDIAQLRSLFGLPDDATEEAVVEAATKARDVEQAVSETATKLGAAEPTVAVVVEKAKEQGRQEADSDGFRRFTAEEASKLEEDAAAGRQAQKTLYERERGEHIARWLRDGQADPAEQEDLVASYDQSPELTVKLMDKRPTRSFGGEVGDSGKGEPTDAQREEDERLYATLKAGED